MAKHTFKCEFCGKESDFSRRAESGASAAGANPYAKEKRKYRCEHCARINEIERGGYDWRLIDQEAKA